MSFFSTLELLPPDPIFGLLAAYNEDPRPDKVNLGIGAYRDEEGQPTVFEAVRLAEKELLEQRLPKSYLPIMGDEAFIESALEFCLGEAYDSKRCVGIQTIGGTGALRLAGDLVAVTNVKGQAFIPQPTWPNHRNIYRACRFKVQTYPYCETASSGLSFDAMIDAVQKMPEGSACVLQGSCHNPTGIDPTFQQWHRLSEVLRKGKVIPIFDIAYQGFGDGIEEDAAAIRLFAKEGHEMFVAISFSKNFGLYGERSGALACLTENSQAADKVRSQLKHLVRSNYSNPPCHPPRIVKTILGSATLRSMWEDELALMRQRIHEMRRQFSLGLQEMSGRDFGYIMKQKGMFCFSGLQPDQVQRLRDEKGIFVTKSGRINVAGLNEGNISHVIEAINGVL